MNHRKTGTPLEPARQAALRRARENDAAALSRRQHALPSSASTNNPRPEAASDTLPSDALLTCRPAMTELPGRKRLACGSVQLKAFRMNIATDQAGAVGRVSLLPRR